MKKGGKIRKRDNYLPTGKGSAYITVLHEIFSWLVSIIFSSFLQCTQIMPLVNAASSYD